MRSFLRLLPKARSKRLGVAVCLLAPLLALSGFLVLDAVFPFPVHGLKSPASVMVRDRNGKVLRPFLARDEQWRFPVSTADVSPELVRMIITAEDRWFYWHVGINPVSVVRAAWSNWKSGRIVSGASTIPMQIARLAEPKPRSLRSKLQEAFRALQLEWYYSKEELLEIYLNLLPMGSNRQGVGAGAFFYFGKHPSRLSLGESALLAIIPRSPARYDPTRNPSVALEIRNGVLRQMGAQGTFTRKATADALRQSVPARLHRPSFHAPHFGDYAVRRLQGESELSTTLDWKLQQIAERQVASRMPGLRRQGIENASVVVIENGTRALRVMVGSAGFFEDRYDGQVNGATARRSPGSTLKPFLYAVAFDQGRILPKSYLLDIPTDFSGYVAENYDGEYRGRVTAAEALIESLNAPAVRLLAEVSLEHFVRLLKRGGLSTLDRPPADYGLSLVLGSCEVSLLELTNFYASLRDGGIHRPVRLVAGDKKSERRLFSEEAAYLVTRILTKVSRPDLPRAWDLARGVPAVAWKTGTSYGHRDAWAVGFSNHMTIGVWVGNFDGRGVKGISGAEHAGPLLFDMFRAMEPEGARFDRPVGLKIQELELCFLSHQLPGPFCGERISASHLPGRSKLSPCRYHQQVFVDSDTGHLVTGDCMKGRPIRPRLLTVYPAELLAWWRAENQALPEMPALNPECSGVPSRQRPRIVSPMPETPYLLRPDAPAEYQKVPLIAQVGVHSKKLYWYQNGLLIGAPDAGEHLFVSLRPGRHRLVVVDNLGLSDSVTYRVKFPWDSLSR